jgi:glycosidase
MDMETQYVTEDHDWYKDSYGNPSSQFSDYLVYNGAGNTDPESIVFGLTELPGYDGTVRKVTTVNLRNKAVLDYNIELFTAWVDPNGDGKFEDGVDGFRLDHMMDDLDWKGKFTGLFENFWSPLIDSLKAINPNLVFIAEQAHWESWGNEYLTNGNVDRIFAFNLLRAICSFDKDQIALAADSTFSMAGDQGNVIVMIENHDINRFATVVEGHPGKLKAGAALNLLIGGIPSIYFGQEIGMRGDGGFGKFGNTDGNDIPRREAFEWHRTMTGDGMALWYRNSGPWWDQSTLRDNDGISYDEQKNDPESLWQTYRLLLEKRKQLPALTSGAHFAISNDNPYVYSFIRASTDQRLLIFVNLSENRQSFRIRLGDDFAQSGLNVRLGDFTHSRDGDVVDASLGAYTYGVVEISE